jgi:hypothetical protein
MGCDLRGCADSAGVSDSLPTGESRTHNPLVLGSNPSGPTNQSYGATGIPQRIGSMGADDASVSNVHLRLLFVQQGP